MIKRPASLADGPDHYAYVTVTGEGRLADLTDWIGLPPDEGWDRDDLRTRGQIARPYGFSRWSLFSGRPRGAPVEDHVSAVLDRLAPVESAFASLGPECKKSIAVTGSFEDANAMISISVGTHRRAAGFCLDYDFDFYFDGM